ncbi:MAG TPA: nucleotide exchange factor GrpE [Dehalococcoidia bacterium]|nr:nucleotide exchange factor GrpE [Chloroflexota bacterium]HCE76471.1 nucleotide exchange factor GrpE [Dehalococcoidia bacterium]|tara:strand:- start:27714 stop:28313 length:600 start_codon:yes stop_codon:yes gene_type:complete
MERRPTLKKKETPEDTAVGADGQDSNDGVDKDESIEDTVDLSQEIDHYKSIAQRAQADLVNYRNRAIQELEESKRTVQFGLLSRFISVVDDLERAMENLPEESQNEWSEGIALVLRNLEKILELEGVVQIESLGKPFDPKEHEALLYEENTEIEDGQIVSVIQQGYRLNERIIRPARVTVSKFIEKESQEDDLRKQEDK